MTDNLLESGLVLAVYGMGTVFLFLAFLVVATHAMSRAIQKLHHPRGQDATGASTHASSRGQVEEVELVALFTVAVKQFRRRRASNANAIAKNNPHSR